MEVNFLIKYCKIKIDRMLSLPRRLLAIPSSALRLIYLPFFSIPNPTLMLQSGPLVCGAFRYQKLSMYFELKIRSYSEFNLRS